LDRSLEDSTVRTQTKQIIIAPYSNKELRDWPSEHYVTLIRLLTDRLNCVVTLIGSPQQTALLEAMAKQAGNPQKIRNMGGRTAWSDIPGLLQQADLVICNNSGIAHLAAAANVTTLAIYSASHQPQEWGPRGQRSRAVMAVVPCSPCGYDTLAECQHAYRCMNGLKPEIVFREAAGLLSSGVVMVPRSIPIGREL
jgi:ADP-heptose:LPS heptosyltransferase